MFEEISNEKTIECDQNCQPTSDGESKTKSSKFGRLRGLKCQFYPNPVGKNDIFGKNTLKFSRKVRIKKRQNVTKNCYPTSDGVSEIKVSKFGHSRGAKMSPNFPQIQGVKMTFFEKFLKFSRQLPIRRRQNVTKNCYPTSDGVSEIKVSKFGHSRGG